MKHRITHHTPHHAAPHHVDRTPHMFIHIKSRLIYRIIPHSAVKQRSHITKITAPPTCQLFMSSNGVPIIAHPHHMTYIYKRVWRITSSVLCLNASSTFESILVAIFAHKRNTGAESARIAGRLLLPVPENAIWPIPQPNHNQNLPLNVSKTVAATKVDISRLIIGRSWHG